MPAPVNSCPAIPNPVCAKPNPVPAVVPACCAAVKNGWYEPIPVPVNAVACCCNAVWPATDGANVLVAIGWEVVAANCCA